MSCSIGPNCEVGSSATEAVDAESVQDEVLVFGRSEFSAFTTALAKLQADVDLLKVSMKDDMDTQMRQAQTTMEERIGAISQKNSVLEEDLTRVAAELKELKASQTTQGNNAAEGSSEERKAMPKVSLDDPSAELESGGSEEKNQHDHMTWRKTKSQKITDLHYELKETVWDVCLLIGINIMHPADEFIVVLAGVCNIVMQTLFIVIVWSIVDTNDDSPGHESKPDEMLTWRVTYAHDPKYANALQDKTLAFMVCDMDSTNMEGIKQADIYESVFFYRDSASIQILDFQKGPVLCTLCILLWLLTCFKEAGGVLRLFQGVWCSVHHSGAQELSGCRRFLSAKSGIVIKAAERVIVEYSSMVSKSLTFHASFARGFVVTIVIVLPRLIILSSLGFVGVRYLVDTIELEELILNSIALEVILHIDEMLYDIFVPASSKMILGKTHPLPRPAWGPVAGRLQPYMKVLCMIGIVLLIALGLVVPQLNTLKEVDRNMCDGDINFLATPSGVDIIFAGTPIQNEGDAYKDGYKYKAILQKTGLESVGNIDTEPLFLDSVQAQPVRPVFPADSVQIAEASAAMTMTEIGMLPSIGGSKGDVIGVNCYFDYAWARTQSETFVDQFSNKAQNAKNAILQFLQRNLEGNARNCSEVFKLGYCTKASRKGQLARFFCVGSCRLYNPQSGQVWIQPRDGVPVHCSFAAAFLYMGPAIQMIYLGFFSSSAVNNLNPPDPVMTLGSTKMDCVDVDVRNTNPTITLLTESFAEYFTPIYSANLGKESNVSEAERMSRKITILFETWGCKALGRPEFYWDAITGGPRSPYPLPGESLIIFCDPERLTIEGYEIRSFRALCPATCDCHQIGLQYKASKKVWDVPTGMQTQCPRSCFNYTL